MGRAVEGTEADAAHACHGVELKAVDAGVVLGNDHVFIKGKVDQLTDQMGVANNQGTVP